MLADLTCPAHHVGLPTYDVVIPCFNRADTVERALDSVLSQSVRAERILLVDDGSSDGTASVLVELERRHDTVQAVLLPRNSGASAARNAGLALARAEWVGFLDSDDSWLAGAAQAMLVGGLDGADVVVGRFQRAWASGTIDAPECAWDGGDILAALAVTGAIGPSWSLTRRAVATRVAGFDPSFHNCNDWDFYVRLAAEGARFRRIDAVIAHYSVAQGNRLSLDDEVGAANVRRMRTHPIFAGMLKRDGAGTLAGT